MKAVLSDDKLNLQMPSNFLEQSGNLSAPALRVMLGYLQFMSVQEQNSRLCLLFDLETYLSVLNEGNQVAFGLGLQELEAAGMLLLYRNPEAEEQVYLLPGTEEGLAQLRALQENPSLLTETATAQLVPPASRPSVYKFYQENIGPLTPYTAELLKDAAQTYSEEWLEDAIKEAVSYNARSIRYIQAILRNWQSEGRKRSNEEDTRDHESFRKLYLDQKRDQGRRP